MTWVYVYIIYMPLKLNPLVIEPQYRRRDKNSVFFIRKSP